MLEDADKPKGGEPSTSKSVGKEGTAQTKGQAAEGAQAPPEGIPPASIPVPTAPQPGTSTGPTQDPTDDPAQDPTNDPAQDPTQTAGEVEIKLTQYVKDYWAAGKVWLDTVVQEKEKAYNTLYDRLQLLGAPHKEGLDQACVVVACIVSFYSYLRTSRNIEAFSLCIVVFIIVYQTICPSGHPWNEGHRPNGSSRDQCL